MQKFEEFTATAVYLPIINIDTDMIIPKQYLKTIQRKGLGRGLFSELRYLENGEENPDFPLNQEKYKDAGILIAGENFGCGSSREHAPWALLDYGIRCVIAPSFADIFYNNCFQNSILPIRLPQEICERLAKAAESGKNARFTIDLHKQVIVNPDGESISFELEPFQRHCLLNGLDSIGLTLTKTSKINDFERKRAEQFSWM